MSGLDDPYMRSLAMVSIAGEQGRAEKLKGGKTEGGAANIDKNEVFFVKSLTKCNKMPSPPLPLCTPINRDKEEVGYRGFLV